MHPDPLVGETLDGRYLIEARIGAGGMGAVYKARHLAMGQAVAIKVLLTDRANDPSMVKRFMREAQTCFQIDHANCVRVTDFGALPDNTLYMVMEFLDGRTVDAELGADGVLSSARVRHIGAQIADALGYAHSLGMIHRDLKPANLMLLRRGSDFDYVKVFDFGLAKLFDDGAMLTGLSLSPLTQAGIVFGTPEYMSPEQALGGDLSPKSDVYTLALCCYEMLTDCLPFEGSTFTEILSKHVKEQPMRPSQKRPGLALESALEDIIMRCLDKDARSRPGTEELAALLRSPGALSLQSAAATVRTDSPITSSETLLLQPSGEQPIEPLPSTVSLRPGKSAPREPASPTQFERAHQRSKSRLVWMALAGAGLAGAAIVGVLASSKSKSVPQASMPSESKIVSVAIADAGASPVDTVPIDAASALVEGVPDAALAQPTQDRRSKPSAVNNAHLRAAEQAFRDKNLLKQLAEANAALKDMPRSQRAAYLVGDALDKSGDKVRACTFFRRSSAKHYRARGCGN